MLMMTYSMTLHLKIVILLLTSELVWSTVATTLEPMNLGDFNDHVDPHSLYYDRSSHRVITKAELESVDNDISRNIDQICSCANNQLRDIPDELFSRRLINILLSLANFEKANDMMTGSISIEITSSQLETLQSFGLGKTTAREVDSIISSIFRADEKNFYDYDFYNIINYLLAFLVMHNEMAIIILIVLSVIWVLWRTNWNIRKFIGVSVFTIFVASFIITYLRLLQEAEINNTAKQVQYTQIPIQCTPHLMNTWQKMWHMLDSHEHCKKYYESRIENTYLQVTPAIALTHMLSSVAFHPAGLFGDAVNDFVQQATKNVWGPAQIIIQPFMIIAVILLMVLAIICIAGGSLRTGIGPFSFFTLKGASRQSGLQESSNNISSKESREPVQVILKPSITVNIPQPPHLCTQEALLDASKQQLCAAHVTDDQKDDKLRIENLSTNNENDKLQTENVVVNAENDSMNEDVSLRNMDSENKDDLGMKKLSSVMNDDNKNANYHNDINAGLE